MWPGLSPIYTTTSGIMVYASKGGKSQYNFKVQYQEPGKRVRTPQHIHLIIDLYMKQTGNRPLTLQLVDHVIDDIILKVRSSTSTHPLSRYSPFRTWRSSSNWMLMANIQLSFSWSLQN